MKKKIISGLLIALLTSCYSAALAYTNSEVNQRLNSCTPTKDLSAGGSTVYQVSGLTGSVCIFKIQYNGFGNKPDLICKVPSSRMSEVTSYNPITVQNIKNQYCVISIKSLNKQKSYY